jgi:hypothetical protein
MESGGGKSRTTGPQSAIRTCTTRGAGRVLKPHKFEHHSAVDSGEDMHTPYDQGKSFKYVLEVYVDDFMSLVIPTSMAQLKHVATAVMKGIHDVFPEDGDDVLKCISTAMLIRSY